MRTPSTSVVEQSAPQREPYTSSARPETAVYHRSGPPGGLLFLVKDGITALALLVARTRVALQRRVRRVCGTTDVG